MSFDPDRLLIDSPLPSSARRVLVAYSGGVDSSVLLQALARLHRAGSVPELIAVHVHHALQPAADAWAAGCAHRCRQLGIDFQEVRVRIAADDALGPEGAARQARYAALRGLMKAGDVLATAHHQDDQAETVLMRALRGAGTRGLAAIRPLQVFGPGWLWRPLLAHSRAALEDYARAQDLSWIEDPHNADTRYERSFLRSEILPALRRRWPAAAQSLSRTAELSAESQALLSELALLDFATCAVGEHLSCAALAALTPARRRNLLRERVAIAGLPSPPHGVLMRLDDLLRAREGSSALLAWPGGSMRRYRDGLWILPTLPAEPGDWSADWDGRDPLQLPEGCGTLESDRPFAVTLTVAFARPRARLATQPGGPHRSLKNLFQEQGIPVWQRRRTPLLYDISGELLWVGGLVLADGATAIGAGLRWHRWKFQTPSPVEEP